jgi:hypothetical protein
MQFLRIILVCVIAAVMYGILHDQVTARVCVEYFTIGHPPVYATDDPTLLGIGWGIIATWWVGLLLGIPLAIVARVGKRPKRSAALLVKPIMYLLGIMAASAVTCGCVGWFLARSGAVVLGEPLASRLPAGRQIAFMADAWAHGASYFVGVVGGIVLITMVWRSRGHSRVGSDSRPFVAEPHDV